MERNVQQLQRDFAAWKTILATTNTHYNGHFKQTTKMVKDNLKNVNYDAKDLEQTIVIVEANRGRFAGQRFCSFSAR